jgi:hypothetical protein
VYAALAEGIKEVVRTGTGSVPGTLESFFVQNGGNFSYEALPWAMDKGLLEGATPECRGPAQLLVYQRAQEEILLRGLGRARTRLASAGVDLGLLKNCRDASGHTYGAQENYETDIARGRWLLLYRLSLIFLAPLSLLLTALNLVLLLALVPLLIPLFFVFLILGTVAACSPKAEGWLQNILNNERLEARVFWLIAAPLQKVAMILSTPLCVALNLFTYRHLRPGLTPFITSRIVFSGAGSLERDGSFVLCEKVSGIEHQSRVAGTPAAHAIFDTGHFVKLFSGNLRWFSSYKRLFEKTGRLQLGLSDSNRCQTGEYLKWGTTCLMIDMLERGALSTFPRLGKPLEALRSFNSDPTLTKTVRLHARSEVRPGEEVTVLELQRWYLTEAQRFLKQEQTVSLEAREVVQLWEQTLDALESSPESLLGSVDWITKRWLIDKIAQGAEYPVQKKIDLKYHELGDGYFDRLEREGLAQKLVNDDEVEKAIFTPPEGSPAKRRGELIRNRHEWESMVVSWKHVRVGGPLKGKIVRLADYQRPLD